MPDFTLAELMVCAAAREVRDGEVVFVGMRLPLLGFQLASATHAPNAVGLYEIGIVRDTLPPTPIVTMGDPANMIGAQWLADTGDVLGLLQRGHVDASFIGGAQIDRFGNLNTSYIGGFAPPHIQTRLPGSGGACDLACLGKRTIIIMAHERRRFVSRVDYITSPGYGDGANWREQVGLSRGGPSAVITTLGVLRFNPATCVMFLDSIHPGVSVDQVRAATGCDLMISDRLLQTPEPTDRELQIIRQLDPAGRWTGAKGSEGAS
jgi:glutaconate CoA-transferase subunit B